MPPLILHNVPDEELYVGDDGVQRPYGLFLPGNDGNPVISRARRTVPETGSFGRSTRRSRSRTGTPAARRENPTIIAGEAIFSSFLAQKPAENAETPMRRTSFSGPVAQSTSSSSGLLSQIDGNTVTTSRKREANKEPTEVILRGYKSGQEYAAIREYEQIAGRICEDYSRDPPPEQRRYRADLRDQASLRQRPLTSEERLKAMKYAGGQCWIKVTFESAEAAEIAVENSPQIVMGHVVYAELYRGVPPTSDEAILAGAPSQGTPRKSRFKSFGAASGSNVPQTAPFNLSRPYNAPGISEIGGGSSSQSPDGSRASTRTIDTGTVASTTSSATLVGNQSSQSSFGQPGEVAFCRKIPTAKRAHLLPAEQALLPQESIGKRIMSSIPLIGWLSKDIIGSALPKNDQGEFDWDKASLYWKIMYLIERWTGLVDISGSDEKHE